MKKTLILGATTNENRYAFIAAHKLINHGHVIVNVGIKEGTVAGVKIEPPVKIHLDIDTITLYLGPKNQPEYYNYILETHPKRIIFNPGTENNELKQKALKQNIEVLEACTLVLLATNQY